MLVAFRRAKDGQGRECLACVTKAKDGTELHTAALCEPNGQIDHIEVWKMLHSLEAQLASHNTLNPVKLDA